MTKVKELKKLLERLDDDCDIKISVKDGFGRFGGSYGYNASWNYESESVLNSDSIAVNKDSNQLTLIVSLDDSNDDGSFEGSKEYKKPKITFRK